MASGKLQSKSRTGLGTRLALGLVGLAIIGILYRQGGQVSKETFVTNGRVEVVEVTCPKEMQDVSRAVNGFGSRLFEELKDGKSTQNVFYSPVSVAAAMSLVKLGTTQGSVAQSELHEYLPCAEGILKTLDSEVNKESEGIDTKIANSLWASSLVKEQYAAQMRGFSAYVDALPKTPERVNQWVEKSTNGLISKILDKVEDDTVALLVNAVYFKGLWRNQFGVNSTKAGKFTTGDGKAKDCKMMNNSFKTMYSENADGSKSVKMAYGQRGNYFGIVTLPAAGKTVAELDPYAHVSSNFRTAKVNVKLPRFKVEFSSGLNSVLQKMGIKKVFTDEGMLNELSESEKVVVSDVVHKAILEVDEYGTKAAAATMVTMSLTSIDVAPPIDFFVDRPFLFTIVHKEGLVLFTGMVNNPSC